MFVATDKDCGEMRGMSSGAKRGCGVNMWQI